MPDNPNPVEVAFTPDRHLDLNGDLHLFFDWLVTGKTVLDVGAGLGKSKARIRHNRVTTYEHSPHCLGLVDVSSPEPPPGPFDVVTAFEVLEHVQDDEGFLRMLDRLATQAIFLTTPNWNVHRCQSRHHVREYTPEEFRNCIRRVWPETEARWFAYYKDAEGGWCEMLQGADWLQHHGLKHAVLVMKRLAGWEIDRIDVMLFGRRREVARAIGS